MRRLAVALVVGVGCSKSEPAEPEVGFEVLGPDAAIGGDDLGALGASWVQWALEHPVTDHPVLDLTGADCAEAQPGDVFFLAGTLGDEAASRTCTASNGGPFLLPVYNIWYDNCGTPPEYVVSDDYLQSTVTTLVDEFDHATLVIDGETVADTAAFFTPYRTGVTSFSWVNPPTDGLYDSWGYPFVGTCDPSYTDGIYVLIDFAPGEHTISLVAGTADFEVVVDYALTVP
jgi:hypothetical protein